MTPDHSENPRDVYGDIIGLPHWDSPKHPRMSLRDRAAQFAPYAALVGYGDLVKEEARETELFTEPGEDDAEELARALSALDERIKQGERPVCAIEYFVPDEKKAGGKVVTVQAAVRRIDPVLRRLVLAGQKAEEIDLDCVVRIAAEEPKE